MEAEEGVDVRVGVRDCTVWGKTRGKGGGGDEESTKALGEEGRRKRAYESHGLRQ